MKVYKADGTFTHSSDTGFGWTLGDIPVCEVVPPAKETKNKKPKATAADSSKRIHVQEAESALDFDLSVKRESLIKDVDKQTPRSQILDLINPCTVESKTLLSVVHSAMHKNFSPEMIKIQRLQDGAQIPYLEDTEDIIFDGIVNYHSNKKNNLLPLLVELVLTRNKCDVHEITGNVEDEEEQFKVKNHVEKPVVEKSDRPDSDLDLLYQRIQNIYDEAKYLRSQISEIRNDFQEQAIRVEKLIKEARNFQKDLRRTKFLDNLVHLLNGELQRVTVSEESPFRIFSRSAENNNRNLII